MAYRAAWYLCHCIRKALYMPHALMMGVVEVDETYIGGKVKGRGRAYTGNNTAVVGAVERKGKAALETIDRTTSVKLRDFIRRHIVAEAIFTDGYRAYGNLSTAKRRHETVNHSEEEWVRGDVHTNSIENAWSLFKRCVIGAYLRISKKHLDLYLDEFDFRFNNGHNPFIFRDALRELLSADRVEYTELVA